MAETRKLAAILAADVAGYSKLAGSDEERTLARLRGLRSDLFDPAIAAHHGRTVKRTGDGSIVEFRSVVDAVRCAIEVQNGMVERTPRPSWLPTATGSELRRSWRCAGMTSTLTTGRLHVRRATRAGMPACIRYRCGKFGRRGSS
jgi:class 3 adenylate cyclase